MIYLNIGFIDVDECQAANQTVTCNQNCTNIDGGYSCSCKDGYYLYDGDNKTVNRIEARLSIVNHTCLGNGSRKLNMKDVRNCSQICL